MTVVPDPMKFGTGPNTVAAGDDVRFGRLGGLVPAANKGLYYDAAGAPQLEDYIRDATWTLGVTATVLGDMTSVITGASCIFEKRGKRVDIAGTPSITLTYTATAWTGSTVTTVGTRRTNVGNVYEATAAGTTASTGGPTGTAASITDGSVTWKYISAATSGQILLTGLPFAADATAPRALINCVPSSPLTFANNGTALYLATNAGLSTLAVLASKSANSAQSSQVSTGQFAPGVAYTLPFQGFYKAAA
ncbi:hypothetical protein [Methylobacterium sp. Leaf85]|uniref:hypothetical protein n=1 Tax=Methylobacterium sp. Leaf85 TaxID=1736241 RepID=UPI0006F9846C|nr:hypothetical protein [Methylobacterium sp. Leaf85]KQO53059.1 hypothetical protein ASF08_19230 [Methylobacterium sp. Leaf85]